MSDLSQLEKRCLERLFDMSSGYVLDFTNQTFAAFFLDEVGIDIYAREYDRGSGSKANRLRAFWDREPNFIVGKVLRALLDHRRFDRGDLPDHVDPDQRLLRRADAIVDRLQSGIAVDDAGAITASPTGEEPFDLLAKEVRAAIDRNELQAGLDRLHTFMTLRLRRLVEDKTGASPDRKKPLHSLMGEYVKLARKRGQIESEMTDMILKCSMTVLDKFNYVRNEQSLAHPNPVLNHDEALLIFKHVTATLRFIDAVEQRCRRDAPEDGDDEVPF